MAEAGSKKTKIYNLAKDLNLSSETLIEFLKKKGIEAKTVMSTVDESAVAMVFAHFKKDKDVADRHQRKMQEFRSTKKKETAEKAQQKEEAEAQKSEEAEEETVPPQVTPVTAIPEKEIEVREEQKPATVPLTETGPAGNAEPAAPAVEIATAAAPEIKSEKADSEAVEKASKGKKPQKPERKTLQSPLEALMSRPQRGLTIKGKIDLTPAAGDEDAKRKKKKKKKIKEEVKKVKSDVTHASEEEGHARKKKRTRKAEVDEGEVQRAIRETLEKGVDEGAISRAAIKRKKKEKREEEQQRILDEIEAGKTHLTVTEFVSVGELANLMHVSVAEVIQKVMGLGMMVSINQRLEKDTILLVADEFGFQVSFENAFSDDVLVDIEDSLESLKSRPPVVTIMGHVDHGKTSLLDYIRNSNVVAGESGGITQHIGAYKVVIGKNRQITFLDTPGHEAFTAMRARGAQVTDIVVLVVAADDSVMPQTIEAISHAQAANVPIIVALNKIDKPDANPERIKQQLAERGLLVEEYGGKSQAVELSAKTGKNVDLLLEKIVLEAEMLDLKANPDRLARGAVIEAELDKGKGIVATILVQKGTLHVGDSFVCGVWSGRVRAMFDERGQRVDMALPSQPVQITGFDGIPQAGDDLIVLQEEREAREISTRRQQLKREQDFRQTHRMTLDDISSQIKEGQVRDLPVIVKTDVDGSAEALSDSLMKLSTDEVVVRVIYKGVGGISESDVLLALASNAVIIGFHVRPNLKARQLAQKENLDIRLYNIIYDAINDVKNALEGLLAPTISEEIMATVEIRDIFKVSKIGTIAGCYVKDGKISRSSRVRLVRDGVEVFDGTISSLKRFKDDVRDVEQGFECGIGLENFNDMKVGDIVEAYRKVETKRKLD